MDKKKIKYISKNVINAEDSKEIEQIAKKRDVQFPSEHLGFFKTIYCEIEKTNLNGVRLSRKAVEEALPTLISAQVNFSHLQAGFIMGSVLDAWINDNNEIEIVYSFYKEIYPNEYEQSIELAKNGELAVSFELLSETESQEYLADGTIRLNDITFIGVGHLMSEDPACPSAKIYEFASQCKERLLNVNEKSLVFASKINEKCDEILEAKTKEETENPTLPNSENELDKHKDILANQKENKDESEQGGIKKVTEEQNAKIEKLWAELGIFAKDFSDEDLLDETVVAKIRKEKELKTAEAEATPEKEEVKTKEESKEEVSEEEATEETEEEKASKELAYKVDSVEIRTFSLVEKDGVEIVEESVDIITVRDYNAMKEAVAKVEELEASLEAKNSEIEVVRENAEKIGKTKVQLKDNEYAKDFSDEDYLNEEKVVKAIQDQKDAETVASRKEELKDNEYAKDYSDKDLLNDDKVELAKVKKEKDELEAKVEPEKTEVEASAEEAESEMDAGNTEDEKTKSTEVMASIRKDNTEQRETQKVYERK